ncbi:MULTISPECIES: response regulator transcription factor [unclassified Modestobacter]|uniref:response regulator transcription factor n=1 Tax=unclassified Modestobacter TaxID=2643866 RepID=UPI0022AA3E6B|nr:MULTISPECIES: response regulator transcription factor [unclassified Modestobacter]MCZ2827195.1 response regulator transcription factor [Modestobacter sp. VKM Ac-2981]MCZ2854897.1 response regulator transcription factor [Modestobacter sp. VKM Ac-2982]
MRVLVVEDEANLAAAVARGLRAEGFGVDVAGDGVTGLERALSGGHAAIVLDIMLPGRSGYDVLRELRARQVWTPVLMLTAKDGEYDIADALDLGADDYLTKPFSFVVLVARLRALARRGASERPAQLAVADLVLDPAAHKAWRGDTEVALTAREFALLAHLMRRAGDAVSKSELLTEVWDEAFAGDPNIVEVYIGYLRRKIDVPFGRKAIETVRGVGYRIDTAGG